MQNDFGVAFGFEPVAGLLERFAQFYPVVNFTIANDVQGSLSPLLRPPRPSVPPTTGDTFLPGAMDQEPRGD